MKDYLNFLENLRIKINYLKNLGVPHPNFSKISKCYLSSHFHFTHQITPIFSHQRVSRSDVGSGDEILNGDGEQRRGGGGSGGFIRSA